ncbi:D-alanyl-D-alanine carboxypeptidase/D-alanyl-D-alanine-endopeptidase (penicillin-binding protein 4) [Marmoricola sp. OAE513]|uniref:D-alanyl-D-alanine carboxypeptidase/D-alanyl-D-alanine endopeptidase n=1 Tax=Marmoricola sp. OAE513 TaxID=2817894 RepID=UPI001AE1CBA3
MAAREQRHVSWSRDRTRLRRFAGWLPEVLVVLLVASAGAQLQFDLGHRWFGLERTDPTTAPAQVPAPRGLDLSASASEPPLAATVVPGALNVAAVRTALAPLVTDPKLGGHGMFQVADLSTGEVVYRRGAASATPASTMKLLTGTAALAALGPGTRFTTRVVGTGDQIVLVGGGDPFLASSKAKAKGHYPARADLRTLAKRTAAALGAQGIRTVTLGYDTSMFRGPAVNPRWPDSYLPDNVVPPISALWADEAKGADGRYVADPARTAAEIFAKALRSERIGVTGAMKEVVAPATATDLAAVTSSPVGEIVQQTLAVSDNNAAEVLARHVGASLTGDASFTGGTKAIFAVLKGLGVDVAGSVAYDGSGLSRDNRLTATTLLDVLRVAASSENPKLREVVTGLPIAGFTGSLQRRFATGPDAAKGRVRAKTGTLTGVHGLAGIAADVDGNLMAFVLVVDKVAVQDTLSAQHELDLMAGALGSCRCGS